jgi:hypothetical protein
MRHFASYSAYFPAIFSASAFRSCQPYQNKNEGEGAFV